MAYQFVHGFNGHFIKHPTTGAFVALAPSPGHRTIVPGSWSTGLSTSYYFYLTGSFVILPILTGSPYTQIEGTAQFYIVTSAPGNLNFTLSWNGDFNAVEATVAMSDPVNSTTNYVNLAKGGTVSSSLAYTWYRSRFTVTMTGVKNGYLESPDRLIMSFS